MPYRGFAVYVAKALYDRNIIPNCNSRRSDQLERGHINYVALNDRHLDTLEGIALCTVFSPVLSTSIQVDGPGHPLTQASPG